ncbi:MAG: DNA ligase [Alteromonadaceae bacterium]|nr:DNA ligase [Alteromonadaceae bacterium]
MKNAAILLFFIFDYLTYNTFLSAQNLTTDTVKLATQQLVIQKPPIQKGTIYHSVDDISQYWVSEKLDGVRGYWNGEQLLTRQGHRVNSPIWFTKHWPKQTIDGELWIDRAKFEQVSGIIRQQNALDTHWRQIHFMIFDLPNATGDFSTRIKQMQTLVAQVNSPYFKMIKQEKFYSTKALFDHLDEIIKLNGEGLMLHHQSAYYRAGRVKHLMKLKKYQDAEAIVLEQLQGKGKFKNMLGALRVKTSDGLVFKIGSGFSNEQRKNPPAIGSQITYKYFGKTKNGVPRFASFMRIRETL